MPTDTISDDEFNNAFAELNAPAAASAPAPAAAPAAAAPAADTVTPPADKAPVPVVPPDPAGTPDAAPAAATSDAAPAAAATPSPAAAPAPAALPDTAAELAALRAEIAALKNAAPTPAPAPAPAAEAAPAVVPVYTTDETAALAKYKEEWPDIHAGEALQRRAEYRELVGYIFSQLNQRITPLEEMTQSHQGRSQYSDIVALVPDYDQVRDATLAWIETQPAYLKEAYTKVANTGTGADVADLINRYKKESGYVAADVAAAAAAAPVAAAAALPAPAAAAVAALKVVKTSRTEQTQAVDPNDFDGAFAEFANVK